MLLLTNIYLWFNKKNSPENLTPNLDLVIPPASHSDEILVPVFTHLPSLEDENDNDKLESSSQKSNDGGFVVWYVCFVNALTTV